MDFLAHLNLLHEIKKAEVLNAFMFLPEIEEIHIFIKDFEINANLIRKYIQDDVLLHLVKFPNNLI